jgi:radical SAM enzyme (rSAM/lipoprotein system)
MLRRILHPLYRHLETDVHPLRYVFFEVTQRCNLSCRHCGSDCHRDAHPQELSIDEWLAVCDQLARDFEPKKLAVVLTGGEPLCCPNLDRLLERLQVNGLPWGMVTNGWLLTERNVERLQKRGIASATVSLDGLREDHDWLRGRDGSFERAVAGIERLAQARLSFFDVVTCVHPRNLPSLPKLQQLLRSLGVPAWRLFPIFAKGRARTNRELLLSAAEFQTLLGFLRDARASSPGLEIELSCEGYLPETWDRAVRSEPYFCRAGIAVASVLCDGGISACPSISRALVQGNIRDTPLRRVWDERFERFRDRSWLRTGRCKTCQDFGRCQGNSLHLWEETDGEDRKCTLDLLQGCSI